MQRLWKFALWSNVALLGLSVYSGYVYRFLGMAGICRDWANCVFNPGLPTTWLPWIAQAHLPLAIASGVVGFFLGAMGLFLKPVRRLAPGNSQRACLMGGVLLLIAQGAWSQMSASWRSQPLLLFLHLALGLGALTCFLIAAAHSLKEFQEGALSRGENQARRFRGLVYWVMGMTLLLMLSGYIFAYLPEKDGCSFWQLCFNRFPTMPEDWVSLVHHLWSGFTLMGVLMVVRTAWKRYRQDVWVLSLATAVGVLFIGQVIIGGLNVLRHFPADLVALHALNIVGLWGCFVLLALAVSKRPSTDEVGHEPAVPLREQLGAYLVLNKPVIVLLLLVTTYAGMVIAGKRLPSLDVTLWTLLGGALAAGGASAINQYIDREIDRRMQRTAKRPIPSGRVTPAQALAYGIAACLTSFFILAGMVNLLSALLSLAGMVYYVVVYSLWLKQTTPQNIVIGGGAGAIPPLVGWAAINNDLQIPALFLFAIIFLWTPPHFWALALVRQKDYARAGVPMLPVVRGERATRWQILIYTLELVGLTLLMPLFNLAGSLFLVAAALLGAWLIHSAWRVWKRPGNRPAYFMYRASSMYLALIFLALVIDALV